MIKHRKISLAILAFTASIFFACNLDKPTACMSLSTDYFMKDSVIVFNNCSIGADSYLWDFGDGTTSTEESPEHIYTESDTFRVSLNVEGKNGKDEIYHTITVWEFEE